MRAYIGCFGSGLGHASRMLEVARELTSRGAAVEFSSSGEVASLVSSRGYRCNPLPLADVRYSSEGEFLVRETLIASPLILGRTFRQVGLELANMRKYGPDVVISDSALPTVLAAKVLGLPAYTVLNQLNLTSSVEKMGSLSKLFSVGVSAGMSKMWKLSDEVLFPDLPPPYTISERNLWGAGLGNSRYVGFIFSTEGGPDDRPSKEFASSPKPKVFWQVSGPPPTRGPFLKAALRAAAELSGEFIFAISAGDPGGETDAAKVPGGWQYGWCSISDTYFRSSDVIVSRAGHGTVAQAITSGKPSLLVPIPKQPEQEGNAQKAERLGVSLVVRQGELTPVRVKESLHALLGDAYASRSESLKEVAERYDARKAILSAIESGARRGRPIPR